MKALMILICVFLVGCATPQPQKCVVINIEPCYVPSGVSTGVLDLPMFFDDEPEIISKENAKTWGLVDKME